MRVRQPPADRFWLTAGGSRSVSPAAILGDFKASGRTAQYAKSWRWQAEDARLKVTA